MSAPELTLREQLEFAAKASGVEHQGYHVSPYGDGDSGLHHDSLRRLWNPLTDDGDALRLAVRLKLTFRCAEGLAVAGLPPVVEDAIFDTGKRFAEFVKDHGGCELSATRLAIFRAAVEIGRAMP